MMTLCFVLAMNAVQELDYQLSVAIRSLNASIDQNRLSHVQDLLKELEIQLKGSAPSEYLEEKVHARNYRQQLASLTRNKEYGKDSETYSRRDQMLKQTNRIEGSSERLKRTQIIALENERIGGDILNTLRGQRETIERTKDTIAEAEDNVDRSNKTLKSMASWW